MIHLLRKLALTGLFAGLVATHGFAPAMAQGKGDLLVAPTRVVLDGKRGTEIILNNVGAEEATYRISLELRRMTPDGALAEVTPEEASQLEQASLDMIRYAPRRVTLPPNQPQAIRIGVRAPEGLPDGEYRAHMLFRAIPKAEAITETINTQVEGLSIALTPIYGVTIPIIIRRGRLEATASLANGRLETLGDGGKALAFDLARAGDGSVYGEIRVTRQGDAEPIMVARGIAIYPELDGRTVRLNIPSDLADALRAGPVTIAYYEAPNAGGGLISQIQTTLQ